MDLLLVQTCLVFFIGAMGAWLGDCLMVGRKRTFGFSFFTFYDLPVC
jgi:hypothetical protein